MGPHAFALLLLCLSRASLTVLGSTETPETPSAGTDAEEQEGPCQTRTFSQEAKQAVGAAITKLGLKLLERLQTGPEQPNVIMSPFSVALALSQLALGARNETEELLLRSLHAYNVPCYQWILRTLIQQLDDESLQVASRLYVKPGFKLKQDFINESFEIYSSRPVPLHGLEEVNKWVENATNGRVTDLLSSLPLDVILLLVNAVHFKGEWKARFDPRFTSKELFYIDGKNAVYVDMMLGPKYLLSTLVDGDLNIQVARFPFKDKRSLLVAMPMQGKINISALAHQLDFSRLYARLPPETIMPVKLPKFKLEYSKDLENALTGIGLGQLFQNPDLSGVAEEFLKVSSVQHKSSMELHEEGAEGAAVTALVINRSNPTFSVNQPFFFALVDDATYTPLFLGMVNNPDPGAAPALQSDHPGNTTYPLDKEFNIPPPK